MSEAGFEIAVKLLIYRPLLLELREVKKPLIFRGAEIAAINWNLLHGNPTGLEKVKTMKSFKPMSAIKHTAQLGFTIIELVVVILLLGILTATALPRFIDVTSEAHEAAIGGVAGGLRTGIALYKANWFALNQPTDTGGIADWGSLIANASGFPIGISGGVSAALTDTHSECASIGTNLLQNGDALIGDADTMSTTVVADTVLPMTGTILGEAAAYAGEYDFVANLQTTSTCRFWYLNDQTRLATTTAPYLEYTPGTGSLLRGNIPAN